MRGEGGEEREKGGEDEEGSEERRKGEKEQRKRGGGEGEGRGRRTERRWRRGGEGEEDRERVEKGKGEEGEEGREGENGGIFLGRGGYLYKFLSINFERVWLAKAVPLNVDNSRAMYDTVYRLCTNNNYHVLCLPTLVASW